MNRPSPREVAAAKAVINADKQARKPRPKPKLNKQARVRDNTYLAWVRRLPCVNCGAKRSEAAHIRCGYPEAGWSPTGMQRKPDDARTAPLCASCHREGPDAQHRTSERAWWAERGIYPPEFCAALHAAFEANSDGAAVIAEFIQSRGFQPGRNAGFEKGKA